MGDVVPFIARVRSSGDWTAAERARLEALAERVSGGGPGVEAIFGATDEGDPWCVVTDETGEVLIHVARIGGKFVVHSAVDDALSEGADLHATLRERLNTTGDDEADRSTVVPFSLAGRQAQTFLALLVAAAFFYETIEIAPSADEAAGPVAMLGEAEPPPPLDLEAPTHERELAVQGAALTDPAPQAPAPGLLATLAPVAAPLAAAAAAPEAPSAMAPTPPTLAKVNEAEPILLARSEERVVAGTSGDDVLVGGAADERILGGDGDDTLLGGGGLDTLEGGTGADRIELAAGVTALGGEGGDTFVITAPPALGRPDTLLGVISDFDGAGGDVLMTFDGRQVVVARPGPEPQEPVTSDPPEAGDFGITSFGPTRVDVDLDEDGVVDGYVLVGQVSQPSGSAEPQDGAVEIVGRALPPPDLGG